MTNTVMHLCKKGVANSPLINDMCKAGNGEFRTLVCYLSGTSNKENKITDVVDGAFYLDISKKQINWTSFSTLRKVAALIDSENVDLLVPQFRRQIPIAILAALLSKKEPKVIAILHGIVGGKVGLGRRVFNFLFFRRLSYLVGVSNAAVKEILRLNWGLDSHKVIAVPNGIDPERILIVERSTKERLFKEDFPHLVEKGTLLFGSVGRLTRVKNNENFIRAFAKAAEADSRLRLALAGKGPDEEKLKALVGELGLNEKVAFLGFRNDVPCLLKVLDFYVMPSLREGLSLAMVEAMIAGAPILTSDRGSMREVVGDEPCGVLIDPDDVNNMTDGILRIAASTPEDRKKFGDVARERALREFSAERMSADYGDLFRRALAE